MNTKACFYCENPSTILCDGILGHLKSEDGKHPKLKVFTCDRPLCPSCAQERTVMHINKKPRHVWDTMDYCPDCVKEERHFGGNRIHNGMQRPLNLLTEEQGKAAQARRLMKIQTPRQQTALDV